MESSSSSSASQEVNELISSSSKRSGTLNMVMGKHRLAAAIASLNQQIQIIQDELDQLDSFGEASIVCRETRGPINVHLDRWFHGASDSRRNKRWL
ncbi:PREDICTED: guanine nucleotide-binding protein subunit gamma 2-like isoform X2 [Nicotiana attenuata]|uniref:guanine nucleotide-binding protein subunit gamma 2-like isoform X2 n=1 Tax=Nicotiana attenuata TaxID=49451 RepID=UPI000905C492|nr:PREDICTED: guanine nucleotide-binding protein subunit gamma 2-like isoform X2 [Nicotiana attenuata]